MEASEASSSTRKGHTPRIVGIIHDHSMLRSTNYLHEHMHVSTTLGMFIFSISLVSTSVQKLRGGDKGEQEPRACRR